MKKLLLVLFLIIHGTIRAQYTVTVYNPVPSQTSGHHLQTADGSLIDLKKLEDGTLRWCAVSRDILEEYKYGDKIEILWPPEIKGIYEIHDTMNKRYKKHIDILMPEKINTGKWTEVKIKKTP